MKKINVILLAISTVSLVCAKIPNPADYQYKEGLSALNSHINIVRSVHDENELFIIKQKVGREKDQDRLQMLAVFDKLGASIVERVGIIPGNKIMIIPQDMQFPGKHFQNRGATLHTYISGKPTKQGGRFASLKLNQLYHSVAKRWRGLNISVIKNMAKHPDLPAMCALDTFVGNSDRCCNNLVYDENIDRFFAFDFSEAFSKPLSRVATLQINNIRQNKGYKQFNATEKQSLIDYRNIMAFLVARNHPKSLFSRIDKYVKEMFGERTPNWSARSFLTTRKQWILTSYEDSLNLVDALNKIIAEFGEE